MENCAHSSCCINSTPSTQQTLDELDFTRGIWTSALNGCTGEVLNFLDAKGVSPNAPDKSGYTALHYCCRNGHKDVCQLLLQRGASPNVQTKSGGVTPLHRAAYSGHGEIVKLLLASGANSLIQDSDGKLPLHKAVERKHNEIIKMLVCAVPSGVKVKDNHGRSPREIAEGNMELIKLLEQVT